MVLVPETGMVVVVATAAEKVAVVGMVVVTFTTGFVLL